MKKIAIFGACREGVDVYRSLYAASILSEQEFEFCYLDNDSRLRGSFYEGVPVYNPNDADLQSFDKIIVGIIAFERVFEQLTSLGASPGKIKRFYSDVYFSEKPRRIGMAKIGKYSYFKPSTVLYNVEIGNYCHIGGDCRLGLIGHDKDTITTYPFNYQFGKSKDSVDCSKDTTADARKLSPLVIADDVYIGEGVTIMAGLTVGVGAIIGSKSVVTRSVPPYTVFAGTPAKQVAERLSPETREQLLASKWWELDKDEAEAIINQIGSAVNDK